MYTFVVPPIKVNTVVDEIDNQPTNDFPPNEAWEPDMTVVDLHRLGLRQLCAKKTPNDKYLVCALFCLS